jgi:methyltransferase family protein
MLETFSGRRPSQNEFELRSFIALLRERNVRSYLEIGARHGDTFWEVVTSLPEGSRAVAVDLPGALWGTDKSRKHLEAAVRDLNMKGYKCSTLFGDSQTSATKRLIVGRGPYDAALIDGDHTLKGVTRDWNLYRDIAPLVAFHDIVGTGQIEKVFGREVEVPILWGQIKQDNPVREFIDEGSAMGIGVIMSDEAMA